MTWLTLAHPAHPGPQPPGVRLTQLTSSFAAAAKQPLLLRRIDLLSLLLLATWCLSPSGSYCLQHTLQTRQVTAPGVPPRVWYFDNTKANRLLSNTREAPASEDYEDVLMEFWNLFSADPKDSYMQRFIVIQNSNGRI